MCDDLTNADNEKFLKGVTRREFGAMAGAAGLAALLPAPANAKEVKGRDVTFATPHGTADGYFAAPSSGKHPAVLVWPDVMGIRPAFRQMGERLAQSGYAVLTVNPFYRSVKGQFLQPGESYADPAVRAKIGPWRALLTPEAVVSDAAAYLGWLDTQIPMVAMVLGFVVIGTTLFVGLGLTSGWPRYAVLSGIAVSIALAAASTYQRWPYVQGRYLLPVLVVVVVIAGLQIDRRSIDRRLVANLLGSLAIAMVVVQVSAFVHDLRRYSVGPNGPMFPGSEAVWQPPLLSVRGFDLLFAAVGAVAVVALLLCRRDVVPRAGTDGGVALAPNVATALGREG